MPPSDRPDTPAAPPLSASRRARSPLATATLTFYATLVCLALALPGSLANALRERPPGPLTDVALAAAERLETAMERTGLPGLYREARSRFRLISCGSPDSANPC